VIDSQGNFAAPKNIIGQSTEREFHESAQIVIIAYV
jgi:hypothetical protein